MKKVSPAAARRYARALLEVALEGADAAAVREQLRGVRTLLEERRELQEALAHPGLGLEKKRALLRALLAGRSTAPVLRLTELLLERQRLALLPAIEAAYATLWNAQRRVAAAQALTAVPLEAAQRRALERALEGATGLGIELETSEDASLLGGLLVQVGGRTYDGTLRGQLRRLRERLTGGAPA